MRIGELARHAGVAVDTVRYYERLGLLPEPRRIASGYRDYARTDLDRLKFIRNSKALGFTLDEIRELMDVLSSDAGDRAVVRQLAQDRLDRIDTQLAQLQAVRESLHQVVARCSGKGPLEGCPIVEAVMAHADPRSLAEAAR